MSDLNKIISIGKDYFKPSNSVVKLNDKINIDSIRNIHSLYKNNSDEDIITYGWKNPLDLNNKNLYFIKHNLDRNSLYNLIKDSNIEEEIFGIDHNNIYFNNISTIKTLKDLGFKYSNSFDIFDNKVSCNDYLFLRDSLSENETYFYNLSMRQNLEQTKNYKEFNL